MSAIDTMTGLLGTVVAAGVVTKVTQSMFPAQRQSTRKARKSKKLRRLNHPGNFRNVGF